MRVFFKSTTLLTAFIAGVLAAPLILKAQANEPSVSAPTLTPQIIDLAAMTDDQIGPVIPQRDSLRTKFLVKTPEATIAIQSGNVPKHIHVGSDEIQYIISGSGTFWLAGKQVDVHPGDLIIIPKGTQHAGNVATNGEFKALSIKIPPQAPGDFHLAD